MRTIFRRLAALAAAMVTVLTLGPTVAQADYITDPGIGELVPCFRSVRVSDVRAFEGNLGTGTSWTQLTFTVTSTGCLRGGQFSYQTVYGSADSWDFSATSGTVTLVNGDGAPRHLTVWVHRDNSPGPDEYLWMVLTNASSGLNVTDAVAKGYILNDDSVCVPPPDLPPGADYHCSE